MLSTENFKKLFKGYYSLEDVIDYFRGMIRYRLWNSKYYFFIPLHIREQINFRIEVMDKDCFENGTCKLCGCMTTALQMANKACEKPCYPHMLNKKDWKSFKSNLAVYDIHTKLLWQLTRKGMLIKKEIKYEYCKKSR